MKSTIIGAYPRIGSEVGKELRRRINHLMRIEDAQERKKCEKDVSYLQLKLTREIVEEQIRSGINIVNYGFVDVHDELTWPLENMTGIYFRGMKKIYHTNIHHKVPVVKSIPELKVPLINHLWDEAVRAVKVLKADKYNKSEDVKIELPGPITLSELCIIDRNFISKEELSLIFAEQYKTWLDHLIIYPVLQQSLPPLIQFNEPSLIAYERETTFDTLFIISVYEKMLENFYNSNSNIPKTCVWTFYGTYDEKKLETLFSLPIDIVGLDFVWDPNLESKLLTYFKNSKTDKSIGLGLIDSGDRGYLVKEKPEKLVERIKPMSEVIDLSKCLISCNATLEHLPREYARDKLWIISRTVEETFNV